MASINEVNAIIGSVAQLLLQVGAAAAGIAALIQTAKNKAYGKSGAARIQAIESTLNNHDGQLTALGQNVGAAMAAAESLKNVLHPQPGQPAPSANVTVNTAPVTETPPETPAVPQDAAEDIPATPAPIRAVFDDVAALNSAADLLKSASDQLATLQARRAAAVPPPIPGALDLRVGATVPPPPNAADATTNTGPG